MELREENGVTELAMLPAKKPTNCATNSRIRISPNPISVALRMRQPEPRFELCNPERVKWRV